MPYNYKVLSLISTGSTGGYMCPLSGKQADKDSSIQRGGNYSGRRKENIANGTLPSKASTRHDTSPPVTSPSSKSNTWACVISPGQCNSTIRPERGELEHLRQTFKGSHGGCQKQAERWS